MGRRFHRLFLGGGGGGVVRYRMTVIAHSSIKAVNVVLIFTQKELSK